MEHLSMEPYRPDPLPLSSIDWERHISDIAAAVGALARFDGILQSLPNAELLLAPIFTQEAIFSTRIEGTRTTLEEVLENDAENAQHSIESPDIQEVSNYRKALRYAINVLKRKPLTLNLIKKMHSILLDEVRGNNKRKGEFRTVQNWIGRPGTPIGRATFIPPSPLELPTHLSNFEAYYHSEEKARLIQLAIIHAQFELLHPFLDGNGRIGRILIPLFLYEKGVISHPSFYISAFFEANQEIYYDRLEQISKNGAWDDWITFFLQGLTEQALFQTNLAQEIKNHYEEIKERVTSSVRSQYALGIVDYMFAHPIFKIVKLSRKLEIPKATMSRLLKILIAEGVIVPVRTTKGRSGQIYRCASLLQILEKPFYAND